MSEIKPATKSGQVSRRLTELRNLPVVSITDGVELGTVSSFLLDYERGHLAAFVLSSRKPGIGVRAVPYNSVSSFGSFAVTLTKAGDVCDLTDNKELLALFEKDVPLLGSKVCFENDDRIVGFVKDVSVSLEDGSLLLLTVTSDTGFTSPYRATVPFSTVKSVTKDVVVLSGDQRLSYRKEGVLARSEDRSGGFVPLVLEDAKWRETLDERIREAMEKVHRELKDRFFADHEQFYLSHEKERILAELTKALYGKIEEYYEKKFNDTAQAFKELLMDAARNFVSEEKFAEEISATKSAREADKLEIETKTVAEVESVKAGADDAISRVKAEVARIESTYAETLKNEIEAVTRKLNATIGTRIDALRSDISVIRQEIDERTDTRVLSLTASVQEFERGISKQIEAIRESVASESEKVASDAAKSVVELEKKTVEFEGKITEYEKESAENGRLLKEDILNNMDALKAELETGIAGFKSDLENAMAALRSENESRIGDAEARTDALVKSVREDVGHISVTTLRHDEYDGERKKTEESLAAFGVVVENLRGEIESRMEEIAARIPSIDPEAVRNELRGEMKEKLSQLVTVEEVKILRESLIGRVESELVDGISRARNEFDAKLVETSGSLVKEVEKVAGALEENRAALRNDVEGLMSLIEALKGEIEDKVSEKALATLGSAREELRSGIENLSATMGQLREEIEEKTSVKLTDGLETARVNLRYEVETLTAAIDLLKGEIEEKATAKAAAAVEFVKNIAEKIEGEIAGLASEVVKESDFRAESEKTAEKYEELLKKLESRFGELAERIPEFDPAGFRSEMMELLQSFARHDDLEAAGESLRVGMKNEIEEASMQAGSAIAALEGRLSRLPEITPEDLSAFKKTVFDETIGRAGEMFADAEKQLAELGDKIHGALSLLEEKASIAEIDSIKEEITEKFEEKASLTELEYIKEDITKRFEEKASIEEIEGIKGAFEERFDEKAGSVETEFREFAEELRQHLNEVEEKIAEMAANAGSELFPEELRVKFEIEIEKLKQAADDKIAEAAGRLFAQTPEKQPEIDIKALVESQVESRVKEIREEILQELAETAEYGTGTPTAIQQIAPDAKALEAQVLEQVTASIREKGIIKLMFDADKVAEKAASFPDAATEEQAGAFLGSDLEEKLIGKRSRRDIYTDDNFLVVKKGEMIDKDVIRRARDYGKFLELTLDPEE